jgi:hypothetical protein
LTPQKLQTIAHDCLKVNANDRPSAAQIVQMLRAELHLPNAAPKIEVAVIAPNSAPVPSQQMHPISEGKRDFIVVLCFLLLSAIARAIW